MQELKKRLALELPFIEDSLQKVCASLPAPMRPIVEHTFAAGGKRLRPFLVILVAKLLGYNKNDIYDLAVSMEMLHCATLLHDDVLDNAQTRRGKIAAHHEFGVTSSILAGDALLAAANSLVAKYDDIRLCHCFSEATMKTAVGEILEMQYLRCLEQEESVYNDIVLGKTAWLLRASCTLGALKAKASPTDLEAIACYGQELGMAFQWVDDALDFAPEQLTGKTSGGDILEGKLTYPIRLYREYLQGHEKESFDLAFSKGTFSANDVKFIGEEICRLGFDKQTRIKAGQALEKAKNALNLLSCGKQSTEYELLLQMANYVQEREK